MLTVETVSATVPPAMKNMVTQSLVDRVNNLDSDPDLARAMRENFVSYTSVLTEGKFKFEDYISAVKYVSFLLMKYKKREAWIRTFPERYQKLKAAGTSDKDISAHASMYAGGKLVNLVYERTAVPFHVLNQDVRQRALNKLVHVMATAQSDFVVVQAANAILQHLTPPKAVETAQLNVNIGMISSIGALEKATAELVTRQRQLIESKTMTTREIAEGRIIQGEVVSVE
jgi:hypothetical protein